MTFAHSRLLTCGTALLLGCGGVECADLCLAATVLGGRVITRDDQPVAGARLQSWLARPGEPCTLDGALDGDIKESRPDGTFRLLIGDTGPTVARCAFVTVMAPQASGLRDTAIGPLTVELSYELPADSTWLEVRLDRE